MHVHRATIEWEVPDGRKAEHGWRSISHVVHIIKYFFRYACVARSSFPVHKRSIPQYVWTTAVHKMQDHAPGSSERALAMSHVIYRTPLD